jgi:phage portal protein BeeE
MPLPLAKLWRGKSVNPYGATGSGYTAQPYAVDFFNRDPPPSPQQLVRENRNTAYACAVLNADLVAKTRLRLYVKTRVGESKPKQNPYRRTRKLSAKAIDRIAQKDNSRTADADDIEEVTTHPVLNLLAKPNGPDQDAVATSRYSLIELTQRYLEIVGRAYWWTPMDGPGKTPSEIWIFAPQYVTEWPGSANGPVISRYTFSIGSSPITYQPQEIIPFRFADPFTGGYTGGMSPLYAAFDRVKLDRQIDALTNANVSNGGRPSSLFIPSSDPDMGGEIGQDVAKRIRIALRAAYAQAGAGGVLVATHPGQLQVLNWPIQQLVEATRYGLLAEQICQCFGVPVTKLSRSNSNRASAESGDRAHAVDAGLPRLRRMEATLDMLVNRFDDSGRFFFLYDDPPGMEDSDDIQKKWQTGAQYGEVTRNEYRDLLGLAPVPGGDIFLVPNTFAPLNPDGTPNLAYYKGGNPPPGEATPGKIYAQRATQRQDDPTGSRAKARARAAAYSQL